MITLLVDVGNYTGCLLIEPHITRFSTDRLMKYFTLGEITSKAFTDLVAFLAESGDKQVIIDSCGGDVMFTIMMIKELNKHANFVSVVGMVCCSGGLHVFAEFEGTKYLVDGAIGLAHLPRSTFATTETKLGKTDEYDKMITKTLKQLKGFGFPFLKKKERAQVENNEDVWLDFAYMKSAFPEAEIIEC